VNRRAEVVLGTAVMPNLTIERTSNRVRRSVAAHVESLGDNEEGHVHSEHIPLTSAL